MRAVQADWVLTADVPLASRDVVDQKLALQEAMRRVLVRLSGKTQFGTSVPLSRAFTQPQLYAKSITAVPVTGGEALRVTFNENSLTSLLQSMRLTKWSITRPQIVVWAAAGGETDARLVSSGGFVSALQNAARTRGVPIVLPRLDALDREVVSGSSVLQRAAEPAIRASARYNGEMVLVGSWRETGGGRGVGDWLLVTAGGNLPFRTSSDSSQRHAEALTEFLVGVASGRRGAASLLSSNEPLRVRVDGVHSLEDYAGVFAALGRISEVRDVRFERYRGAELELALKPKSNTQEMLRALSSSSSFAVDLGTGLSADSQRGVRMRWGRAPAPRPDASPESR